VHNFHQILGPERTTAIFARAAIACIGPTTAAAARELGLRVSVQPTESSIPALVQAICAFYAEQ
jgi:uroporphyrinogen III methyltransferase/synthase